MSDDIVGRLRQTHRIGCDCVGCEAADEIKRLRAVVEAWMTYSSRAERDIETLRAERDEARREVCAFASGHYRKDVVTLDRAAAIAEAESRGWDCFKEKP